MIEIFQTKADMPDEYLWKLMAPFANGDERSETAKTVFLANCYEKVAEFDGDDLEEAYAHSQNGVYTDSWSLEPTERMRPSSPNDIKLDGRSYGRKSTSVGDIFVLNGQFYVVDSVGFREIPDLKTNEAEPPKSPTR